MASQFTASDCPGAGAMLLTNILHESLSGDVVVETSMPYKQQEAGYALTNVLNNKGAWRDIFSSFQPLAFVASVKHPGEKQSITRGLLQTSDPQDLTRSWRVGLVVSAGSGKPCHKYRKLDDTQCDRPCWSNCWHNWCPLQHVVCTRRPAAMPRRLWWF